MALVKCAIRGKERDASEMFWCPHCEVWYCRDHITISGWSGKCYCPKNHEIPKGQGWVSEHILEVNRKVKVLHDALIKLLCLSLLLASSVENLSAQVRVFAQDLEGFNRAAGNPPIIIDFDDIPPGIDISNTTIRGVHFVRVEAPLIVVRGRDTYTPEGFRGVRDRSRNRLYPTTGENVLSPGGVVLGPGPNPEVEGDSLTLIFEPPVQAFGYDHLSQSADGDSWVRIRVYSDSGALLYGGWMPISSVEGSCCGNPGGTDFWGIVSSAPNIKRIEIIEAEDRDNLFPDCNIGFDTFRISYGTALNTVLTAVPASVPADDQTASTLTLTYRYSDGTPIVGRTIRFRSSREAVDTFSSETAVTNAQGQASVTVRSGTVGVATFTCRDETAGVELPASAQVNFTPVVRRRPLIDSVTTSLGVQGPFLEDVSLDNTITVRIADWNGQPGRVEFRLSDGRVRLGQLSGNVATLTLDMGRDLLYSPLGRWNEVQITAYNAAGVASETRTVHLHAVSTASSISRTFWVLPPTASVDRANGKIEYRYFLRWPERNIVADDDVPGVVGSTRWGLNVSQFLVEAKLVFNPIIYPWTSVSVSGSIKISGRSGWSSGIPEASAIVRVWSVSVSGIIEGTGGFETHPLSAYARVTVGGELSVATPNLLPVFVSWFGITGVPAAVAILFDVYGFLSIGVEGDIFLADTDTGFGFMPGNVFVKSHAELTAGLNRMVDRWIHWRATIGVDGRAWLQFPARQGNLGDGYLHQVRGVFYGRFVTRLLSGIERSFGAEIVWIYPPSKGGYVSDPFEMWLWQSDWQEPERDYLYREPYHQVVAGTWFFPQDDNWDVREERLIQNGFPFAEPALAWKDGRAVILYVYDDPNLLAHQSTEIRALMQQPDSSWQDIPVTQDTALDSQPALAVDANGNLVAVWTRIEEADPDPDPNQRLPKAEIAYAVYDAQTGTWSAPTLLTQDNRLDVNPQLVQGANGQLYLLWLKSPDNVFPTDFTQPSLLHTDIYWARWDGEAFADVQRAIARADTLEASLAVSSNGAPLLVWSRDADGNPDTNDPKLYFSYWDGANWTTPQPVWSNPLPQSSPALAMGANNTPVLYFVRSGLAHPEFKDHEQEELLVTNFAGSGWREPLPITRADTLSELQVITHPEGRVSAIWLAASQGVADLWTAIYDPALGYWSNKVRLTQDDMTHEQQVSAAWDPAGNPSAVYIKRQLLLEEREVKDHEGNRYPIQVTVPARADLYLLSHRPKPDLTIREGDLTLEPSNPGPGQEVVIRARVSNLRAMGARNVLVRFYDGNPDVGGTPIGTVRATPDPIVGGSFGTAELSWTVPTDGHSHVLYARVDPENAIAETDETNNTASYPIALLDLEAVAPVVEQYLPDGRVALRFGIRNPSYVSPSDGVRWELRLNSADGVIITQGVGPTPTAGQMSELNFAWSPNLNAGQYTLYLVIDPDNRFTEENETNNIAGGEIALLADLAVNPALTNAMRNEMQVTVDATVQNLGWVDAQNVAVQVLDAPPGLGNVLASGTVASLPRYGSQTLSLRFTLPQQMSRIWIVVNPDGAIQEVRRDNNAVILNLPWQAGDANGDGCVDDADLLMVMFNFSTRRLAEDINRDGSTRRAVRFQEDGRAPRGCELDGIVDDADPLIVLFNFGSGC